MSRLKGQIYGFRVRVYVQDGAENNHRKHHCYLTVKDNALSFVHIPYDATSFPVEEAYRLAAHVETNAQSHFPSSTVLRVDVVPGSTVTMKEVA